MSKLPRRNMGRTGMKPRALGMGAAFVGASGEAETRNPWIARLDREGTASSGGNTSLLRTAGVPTRALLAVPGLAGATSKLRRVPASGAPRSRS